MNQLFHVLKITVIFFLFVIISGTSLAAEIPEIFVQLGHRSSDVHAAAFSPDGSRLVTGSGDKTVKLWDVATGSEIQTFSGHTTEVTAVAMSSDGRQILSGDKKGFIKVWDTTSGREIRSMSLTGKDPEIKALRFSPGERFFTSLSLTTLTVWDADRGNPIRKVDNIRGHFSSDRGETYVTAKIGHQDDYVLLELATGKEIKTFKEADPWFIFASFSQDGKYALFVNQDYGQKKYFFSLFDIDRGEKVSAWNTDSANFIYNIALSRDGKTAITARSGGIELWDALQGTALKTWTTSNTSFIHPSPDGKFILSTGLYAPTLWDTATGRVVLYFRQRPLSKSSFAQYHPGGKQILINRTDAPPLLLDSVSGAVNKIFDEYAKGYFVAGGRYLMLTGEKGEHVLWNFAENKRVGKFQAKALRLPEDNKYLVTQTGDSAFKIWETETNREVLSYLEPAGKIHNFGLSDDGRYFLICVENRVKLIDISTGRQDHAFVVPATTTIWGAQTSRDSRYLVALYRDDRVYPKDLKGILKIWDLRTNQEVKTLYDVRPIIGFTFSPDGTSFMVGSATETDSLWLIDCATGNRLKTFKCRLDVVWEAAFSNDGKLVAVGGADGNIEIWDTVTGNRKISFAGHKNGVRNLSFSPDRRQLMSNGDDGPTRLWDTATGKEIAQLISFKDGEWIVITPEGFFNASARGAQYLNVRLGNKLYSIDNFYSRFYRPELVQLALAGKELPKGENIGDILAKKPAPSVRIVTPQTGSVVDKDRLDITVQAIDNGGGIGDIHVYLNGAQVANETRGIVIKGKGAINEKILSFGIPLLEGENEIRVIAFNGEGSMESIPEIITITSKAVSEKPDVYAIVVGINEYRNKDISLRYAVSDAQVFAQTLKKVARAPLFEDVHIKLLTTPADTTKESIRMAFDETTKKIRPNDIFVFYDASHGVIDVVDGIEQYYLLTSNVLLLSSRHIGRDAMSQKELVGLIGTIPAQKKLVILDTCHAGKAGKEIAIALLQQTRGLSESTAIKLLQRAVGSAVFSASSDTQQALEGYKEQGLFTYAVVEGLKGSADTNKDGYVKISELQDYVEEQVVTLSEQVFKRQQIPIIQTGANFPVAVVK